MGTSQEKRAALSEVMKGNDFGRVDIRLNHEAIARDMWPQGWNTAEIACALGVHQSAVVNTDMHRPVTIACVPSALAEG
jgi:hypothetical protein